MRTHAKLHMYMRTIEKQMSVDGLTGAYNRRAFENRRLQLWKKAEKERLPLSLFIADIDYFKMINDTYGHGEGDYVLKTAVNEMQQVLSRQHAYLARYGGEEFAVLLYDRTAIEAEMIAEDLREKIRNLNISNVNSMVCPYLTISIGGCTQIPEEGKDAADMLKEADGMLYQAKNNGRNQTCWKSFSKN